MTTVSHPDDGPAQLAEAGQPEPVQAIEQRERLRSPALQGGLAFLIYLAVWWGTEFRRVVAHPTYALLDQRSQDPNLFVWALRWWPYAIGHGVNPLFTHMVGLPAGHSLAWVTTVPPIALLATPLTLTAGPVVSLNLLAAVSLPLSAWAAFVLCRRLTGKFWAALAGGAVFGFSAYDMSHSAAGQLDLAFSLLLPVLAYLILVWRDGGLSSRTFVILGGLTMALQFYLMMEVFADLTAVLAVSLLLGLALAGPGGRPQLVRLARVLGLAYAIAAVLVAPYAVFALSSKSPKLTGNTGLDLASLVIPQPGRTYGIAWLTHAAAHPNLNSYAGYVGVPVLLLAVLLAVTTWHSKIVRFLTGMLVFLIAASLGPVVYLDGRAVSGLPWAGLWRLPILRNAYPGRLMLFVYLVLAVATALYLAGPARRMPWARVGLVVLVLAFIALDAVPMKVRSQSTVPAFITSGLYRRQLTPGETVVVVSDVGNAGMQWQAESGFYMRIDGGYFTEGISKLTDLPWPVQHLSKSTPLLVRRFERYVSSFHVGAILVDANLAPRWAAVIGKTGLVGHEVGGVIVYQAHDCQSCHNVDWAQLRA
jgi:hypothetical protein